MKIITTLCLSLLLLNETPLRARAETFRTDINPAMLYYQAFLLTPGLQDANHDYLFTNNWQGQKLPKHFGELIASYGQEMNYLHRAAAQVPACDWGIDMSPGPETLIPELAHCKRAALAARLHAMWALQNGDEEGACDDVLGALALGGNSSRDGTLIGVLVEFAIEAITCSTVAENFNHFSLASLQQLADGLDAGPERGTVASSFAMERFTAGTWLHGQITKLQKVHPNDDDAVMGDLQQLIIRIGYDSETTNFWQQMTNVTGGTVSGLIQMTEQSEAFYQQLAVIVALPHGEFEDKFSQFSDEVKKSKNYLTISALGAWPNSRRKEFTSQIQLAMVKAAIAYKLHGDEGLKSVMDPLGNGPFTCERFVFHGEDRGFKLQSTYVALKSPVTMIFVEKDGPPFNVLGVHAGEAVTP